MQNGYDYSVGVCYSPAGLDKICVLNLSFHQFAFACGHISCRLCYSSHSSVVISHNSLDEFVFLIQGHVMDLMTEVTLSAGVTGLSTAVTGLCEGFEGLSAVDVQEGVHAKGCA
jgi:hypothetical protein